MQDKVYIELKLKTNRIDNVILQINYNMFSDKDYHDLELKLSELQEDLRRFKQEKHLH